MKVSSLITLTLLLRLLLKLHYSICNCMVLLHTASRLQLTAAIDLAKRSAIVIAPKQCNTTYKCAVPFAHHHLSYYTLDRSPVARCCTLPVPNPKCCRVYFSICKSNKSLRRARRTKSECHRVKLASIYWFSIL